jgi:hypothetical protein
MNQAMKIKTFELRHEQYLLKGDEYGTEPFENNTLILHGAGGSSRATFTRMRENLYAHGIQSVSFDFVGHGETGGNIQETTLRGRTEQTVAVIKYKCQEPLTLIGASMGAYSAVKLTERFAVKDLILLVPAVYTPRVYEVPFGPRFSDIIREQESWANSDAFAALAGFSGNIIIIAAEFDEVIPMKLIDQLYGSARNAKTRTLHIVPNSEHLSLFPEESDFDAAMELMLEVLKDRQGG